MNFLRLNNYKIAAVTGASSGIGAAIANELSRCGLEVHAISRRSERLAELKDCVTHVLDVRNTKSLTHLMTSLDIDVLINNAGVGRGFGSTELADPDDIDTTVDTNIRSVIHGVRSVLPTMKKKNSGHIVNIGSMAGIYPLSAAIYGASKAALHMFSMNLRLELQGTGIRVTEICPGRVQTEFYDKAVDDPNEANRLKTSGITELSSKDIAASVVHALAAPWHVNINRIEIQPTEQTYGGSTFTEIKF